MRSPDRSISRFAMFVAAVIFLAIASGGFVTGNREISSQAANGAGTLIAPGPITGPTHAIIAVLAGILTLILAIWLQSSNMHARLRFPGWSGVGLFVADAAASAGNTAPPLPDALAMLHASLAPLLLACVAAVAIFSLPEMAGDSELLHIAGWRSLPMLAAAGPVVVLIQIVFGAAYRHKILSVMPHMGGAMAVALLLLIVCVVTLQQYPSHRSLRPMAVTTM